MGLKVAKCHFIDVYLKRGFKNPFKTKIQKISFSMINNIIDKYNINPEQITEEDLLVEKYLKNPKEV